MRACADFYVVRLFLEHFDQAAEEEVYDFSFDQAGSLADLSDDDSDIEGIDEEEREEGLYEDEDSEIERDEDDEGLDDEDEDEEGADDEDEEASEDEED